MMMRWHRRRKMTTMKAGEVEEAQEEEKIVRRKT
jgi:hypothetical protein